MTYVSVGSELRRLFPRGTKALREGEAPGWSRAPTLPVDVFAAVAHLLEASGAYQYIVAPFYGDLDFDYGAPIVSPSGREIDEWTRIGRSWAARYADVDEVGALWSRLCLSEHDRLVVTPRDGTPAWWAVAHALLVIADEASVDLGYLGIRLTRAAGLWANTFAAAALEDSTARVSLPSPTDARDDRHLSRHVALDSLAALASRDVVRVLPKGRTTELGCNMRTLSHNLALLPPHGRGNAYWHQSQPARPPADPARCNLLLVPFPFVVAAGCFHASESGRLPDGQRWGRFKVRQRWLTPAGAALSTAASRASFVGFVDALVAKARRDGTPVNGVVLPEYALDWRTYDELARHLRDRHPEVEFVISGVSSDCAGRVGNLVTSTVMLSSGAGGVRQAQTHSRLKHHRWRIDRPQIEGYDLAADLDPEILWWEHLAIEERVLHVDAFRSRSTFTAVICEDLARVEPGLSLLRALGPNLVFALLMDGAQVRTRWPGTYATGLADDPGSSVLSFTSLGLVARSSRVRGKSDRPIVALWRNRQRTAGPSATDCAELDLEDGHALIVELASESAGETTLDGRRNDDTTAWYLERSRPIVADDVDRNGWAWIVG